MQLRPREARLRLRPFKMKAVSDGYYARYSLSNPFVHSLSVTLGNHAIPPLQTYNCPCPNGHVSLQEFGQVMFP